MQYQKTKPAKIEFSRELSVQETRLVEALAEGCDNTEAYRRAYGAENYSPAALRVQACRKVAEKHIKEHLDALRSVGLASAGLTLEKRIVEEQAFAKRAELAGNYGAAGGAYDRINKLMGLYVEKYEDTSRQDPLSALKEIEKLSPEFASQLANEHGIAWQSNEPPSKLN